ncbi:MAG: hypothetical protein IKB02_09985 [Clostridia bacterium]|nr:hypothetical protein [Clostridia bacterium]MBR2389063.1 hypothetical protein [Clostridia bacterium]
MKKIFSMVVLMLVALSLCVSICATEITTGESEVVTEAVDEVVDTVVDETVSESLPEGTTNILGAYFSRIWEYIVTHKQELLTTCGDVILVILTLFIRSRTGKKTAEIEKTVNSIEEYAKATNGSQGSVVGAVNGMIDGYNALKDSYEKYGETEDDRNRLVGALLAQNTAILEILVSVYPHSKNLPQGVKDVVMLRYANCLKALDDDEKLKSIVASVREGINASLTVEEPTEEETTETEE